MGQFENIMFSFLSTKRALLSNNENIVERQKKANLTGLAQILCDLLRLMS